MLKSKSLATATVWNITDIPEKLIRKLIIIIFISKGRVEEAVTLHPLAISRTPTETECIISLNCVLKVKYFETEIRIFSKKLENTEKITITPPIDNMEVIDL